MGYFKCEGVALPTKLREKALFWHRIGPISVKKANQKAIWTKSRLFWYVVCRCRGKLHCFTISKMVKSEFSNKIELFNEIGLIGKTITQTKTGTRTEDTKLFKVDFDEWLNPDIRFEDSTLYSNFSEKQFLFIIFEEQHKDDKLLKNHFLGFKRISFSESFIENEVKRVWSDVRKKVFSNKLHETIVTDKNGTPIINKNGVIRTSVNFPKSKDFNVFFRGTGADSKNKPIKINGISMYHQDIWIKGTEIVKMLAAVDFV